MIKGISILIMLLSSIVSYATSNNKNHLSHLLQGVQTLQSNFKQTLIDNRGTELEQVYGKFFLERPGKFRWDYRQPYKQTIVSNGRLLWFYDEDLEQVSIREAPSSMSGMPITVLSGYEDIEQHFVINDMQNTKEDEWVELIPKDIESQYKNILLGFDQGKLLAIVMFDNFGQVTRIDFSEMIINKKFNQAIFNFKLPDGVDILDSREIK